MAIRIISSSNEEEGSDLCFNFARSSVTSSDHTPIGKQLIVILVSPKFGLFPCLVFIDSVTMSAPVARMLSHMERFCGPVVYFSNTKIVPATGMD